MISQELVPDIVKIADDRHANAHLEQPLLDVRDRGGRFAAVDGDAHDLGTRPRQRRHLPCRPLDVGSIGIGHRLHDNGRVAADDDAADIDGYRPASLLRPGFGHVWPPLPQGSARLHRRRQRGGYGPPIASRGSACRRH